MRLTTRHLLKIDGWLYPLNRLLRGRNFSARRKTHSGCVAVIKLMGLGSIIRLISLSHERNVDFSRVILVTFASNREACKILGVHRVLFIRTDSVLHFVRDCIMVASAIHRIKPDIIIDFERCSNAVSLYKQWLSIAGSSSTIGFDDSATVKTPRHTILNIDELTFHEMLLKGIDWMPKGGITTTAASSREKSNTVIVNINCSEYLLARRYPRELFKILITELNHRMDCPIFYLTGATSERTYVEDLASALDQTGVQVHNVAGMWTLTELQQALPSSQLFISGDSGPLHLAIHLGVPTLAIWGPTRPQHFGYKNSNCLANVSLDISCAPCFLHPRSKPARACHGEITCLSALSADAILKAAERLMRRSIEMIPTQTW